MAKALVQLAKRDNMISGFCPKRLENKKSPFEKRGISAIRFSNIFSLNSELEI